MKFAIACYMLVLICLPHNADADAVTLDYNKGLRISWGELRAKTGLRLQADGIYSGDPAVAQESTNTDLRRARITQRLDWNNWRVRTDYDWGIAPGFKNLYAEYRGFDKIRLRAGNHVAGFAMEDAESSTDLMLMERSIANVLRPGLLQGVSYRQWGKRYSVSAGIFGDELNDLDRRTAPGRSLVGRVTLAPLTDAKLHLHLGTAYERRSIDRGASVRFRARPFTRLAERRVVDTRRITGADTLSNLNHELGVALGTVRLQAELTRSEVSTQQANHNFSGYYVSLMTTFGAEPYRYSKSRGVYRGVEPKHSWGAIEIALRLAELDLQSPGVNGGIAKETSFGLAWVINDRAQLQLNHARIRTLETNAADPNYALTGLRFQWQI